MFSSPQMGNTGGFLLIGSMTDKANTVLLPASCIFMGGKRFRKQVKKPCKSISKEAALLQSFSTVLPHLLLTFCPRVLGGLTALFYFLKTRDMRGVMSQILLLLLALANQLKWAERTVKIGIWSVSSASVRWLFRPVT